MTRRMLFQYHHRRTAASAKRQVLNRDSCRCDNEKSTLSDLSTPVLDSSSNAAVSLPLPLLLVSRDPPARAQGAECKWNANPPLVLMLVLLRRETAAAPTSIQQQHHTNKPHRGLESAAAIATATGERRGGGGMLAW